MTPSDEELDDEIMLAFNEILKRIGDRSFNQQKRAYEAWAAKYVPILEVRGRTWHALEVRRRAAEILVSEAISAKRPLATFERLIHNIEALGWTDLHRKSAVLMGMCRYFSDRMWNAAGQRYLLPVLREVEKEHARTGDPHWAQHLDFLRRIEKRLRARRKPS
jgi:hypothetical protein